MKQERPSRSQHRLRLMVFSTYDGVPVTHLHPLFTLLLITGAMYTVPMKAAKRDMKTMVKNVLKDLSNSSTCKSTALYSIGCLARLKNDTSECDLLSIYNTYLTEATALDIQPLVTEQLQSINQYLQDFHTDLCKPEPDAKICEAAFKESDGDYENFCKVKWLLEHFRQWLSR